ncbi:MAG: AAA family ATPase [Bacteroidota bacterium]
MKILVFGASGAGTTTLGRALAERLGSQHLDADDYYWEVSDPPFQHKVPLERRNTLLRRDFLATDRVVVSGSLVSWGEEWRAAFDWAVFLWIPAEVRMERLRRRERERYGSRLEEEVAVAAQSAAFLAWASRYDDPAFEGRSIRLHREWMNLLNCPILCIEGDYRTDQQVERVCKKIAQDKLA